MRTYRWCIFQAPKPAVLVGFRMDNHFEFSGYVLERIAFDDMGDLRAAQASVDVLLPPGLESDAAALPQKIKDWLMARGVTIAAGDRVLHILRKVRAAAGLAAEDVDISSPS